MLRILADAYEVGKTMFYDPLKLVGMPYVLKAILYILLGLDY